MHTLKNYWLGANYALYILLHGKQGMHYVQLNTAVVMLQRMPIVRHLLRKKILEWAIAAADETTQNLGATAAEKALTYIQLTWAHIRARSTRADTEKALVSARDLLPWITTNTKEERLQYADSLKKIGDIHRALGGVYEKMAQPYYMEAARERAIAGNHT